MLQPKVQVTEWVIAALKISGLDETDDENIGKLERLIEVETGGNVTHDADDYVGITAVCRPIWEQFNVGGDPFDPVANIACCIAYQMYRFRGQLIDFYPAEGCGCNQ